MKLVMIAGNNYVFVPLRVTPITRGEVITVDDGMGEKLLTQTYKDKANNYHPYFVDVSDERAAKYVKDADKVPEKKAAAPKRRRRKVTPAPASSAEAVTE